MCNVYVPHWDKLTEESIARGRPAQAEGMEGPSSPAVGLRDLLQLSNSGVHILFEISERKIKEVVEESRKGC